MSDTFIVQASEDPFSSQRVTLDGVDYVLSFSWNERSGWYVGVADAEGTPITQPRRCAVDSNLLEASYHDARCPPGLLYVADLTSTMRDPGFEDLVKGGNAADLRGRVAILWVPL